MRDSAADLETQALHPDAPVHRRGLEALGLQDRALLDVELEVGVETLEPGAGVQHPIELHAVLRQHLSRGASVGVPGVRQLAGVEGAGGGGAPEQAAPEARSLLVGPVHQRERPRRSGMRARPRPHHTEPSHDAEGPVEPTTVRDRVDVRPQCERRVGPAGQVGPSVPRLVDLRVEADLVEQLAQELPRRSPAFAPTEPLCSGVVARPPGELAQVGDDPLGVHRRTVAQPTRSRLRACPRQCAPPPPRVNMSSSSSMTSMPRARRAAFRSVASVAEITRSSPIEMALTPRLKAWSALTSIRSNPFACSHSTAAEGSTSTQTAASFEARTATRTSMWT